MRHVSHCRVPCKKPIRNLGVIFDRNLTMQDYINKQFKSANYNLYNICRIRKFITKETCETLVISLVMSHIDYCNSLHSNLPKSTIRKLHMLQRS